MVVAFILIYSKCDKTHKTVHRMCCLRVTCLTVKWTVFELETRFLVDVVGGTRWTRGRRRAGLKRSPWLKLEWWNYVWRLWNPQAFLQERCTARHQRGWNSPWQWLSSITAQSRVGGNVQTKGVNNVRAVVTPQRGGSRRKKALNLLLITNLVLSLGQLEVKWRQGSHKIWWGVHHKVKYLNWALLHLQAC